MIFGHLMALFIAFVVCMSRIHAQLFKFANSYADHMVLQRAPYKAKLWGYGVPGASVSLNLFGVSYLTVVREAEWDSVYIWKILLAPVEADNKPVSIEISQKTADGTVTKIRLHDVLFGDVWVTVADTLFLIPISP
jgi:sialate O-acetylesterase